MNRKYPCDEDGLICKYCEKVYTRSDNMRRHLKVCKILKAILDKENENIQKEIAIDVIDDDCQNDKVDIKIIPKKKKKIPKNVRNLVWDTHIGEEFGIGKCYVCEKKINSKDFDCGHIIAESKGGDMSIDNLRPVCRCCNNSVGTMNMDDFKKIYFKKKNIITTNK
jgi:hypothetical protein